MNYSEQNPNNPARIAIRECLQSPTGVEYINPFMNARGISNESAIRAMIYESISSHKERTIIDEGEQE